MLGHILPVMAAWINMRHMLYVTRSQQLVHLACSSIESVIVVVAAIKINLQALQVRGSSKDKRRVLLPEALIQWRTKRSSQKSAKPSPRRSAWKFFHQRRHMRAHGNKHPGILEGKTQRSVASHGNA